VIGQKSTFGTLEGFGVVVLTLVACSGEARVYMTQQEALKLAFPKASSIERKTIFLTDEEIKAVQARAGAKVESSIVTYYLGRGPNGVEGYAFFETHTVRTMPETFMAVVNPDGTLRCVEMLAFYEPEDYAPPRKWLGLFPRKRLDEKLWVKRGIRNIAGATLTAQAITQGVRKILAIFELVVQKERVR